MELVLQVKNRKSFEKLAANMDRSSSFWLAFRAGARVLPFVARLGNEPQPKSIDEKRMLLAFRALAVSYVNGKFSKETSKLVHHRRASAMFWATREESKIEGTGMDSAYFSLGALPRAASMLHLVGYEKSVIKQCGIAVESAKRACMRARDVVQRFDIEDDTGFYDNLNADVSRPGDFSEFPLWREDLACSLDLITYREKFFLWEETCWRFWQSWYRNLSEGFQSNLFILRRVSEIPDEVWEAGARAVDTQIQEILLHEFSEHSKRREEIIRDDLGTFSVEPLKENETGDSLESFAKQISAAMEHAVSGNSGFNVMVAEYFLLEFAVNNCLDDAQAFESQVQMALSICREKLTRDEYQTDERIIPLLTVLAYVSEQIRANFPRVSDARRARLIERMRELGSETVGQLSDEIAHLKDASAGRLKVEFEFDSRNLESKNSENVKALSLERAASRAANMSNLEKAASKAKALESSGGMAAAKIGFRAQKILEILSGLF